MNSLRAVRLTCVVLLFWGPTSVNAQDHTWSKRMADSAIARSPDGKITRGDENLSDWAYDKSVLFAGFIAVWQNTGDERYLAYVERAMDALVNADG